jgi:alpha-ribazole phosphatase
MRVGLLRHGEVKGGSRFRGSTDDPLTRAGFAQMQTATHHDAHWDRVISSPLARCAVFASAFARRQSLPCTLDPRLQEIHFGVWEGRAAAELMQTDAGALTRFWSDPLHNTPPDGEPLAHFQARVLDAWNDIVTAHAGQRILIVTHGGVIRVLICHVRQHPLAMLQTFEVKHGGLYCARIGDNGLAIPASGTIARA